VFGLLHRRMFCSFSTEKFSMYWETNLSNENIPWIKKEMIRTLWENEDKRNCHFSLYIHKVTTLNNDHKTHKFVWIISTMHEQIHFTLATSFSMIITYVFYCIMQFLPLRNTILYRYLISIYHDCDLYINCIYNRGISIYSCMITLIYTFQVI